MRVTILNGAREGESRRIAQDQLVVGRCSSCDLHVEDRRMSREHFMLVVSNSRLGVADLHSTNGTRVNNKLVDVCCLHDGDIIKAGRTEFLIQLDSIDSNISVVEQEKWAASAAEFVERRRQQRGSKQDREQRHFFDREGTFAFQMRIPFDPRKAAAASAVPSGLQEISDTPPPGCWSPSV